MKTKKNKNVGDVSFYINFNSYVTFKHFLAYMLSF